MTTSSFNPHIDQETHDLLMGIYEGRSLGDAMAEISLAHAERLKELGPVRVLALDPCPMCMGRVVATDEIARCSTCGWSHRRSS